MYDVAVVKYDKPLESLKKAVDLAGGLGGVSGASKVCIKPNIGWWYEEVNFPKYGAKGIAIVEGVIEFEKESESLLQLAAKGMGLDILTQRYGVELIDVHKGSFKKVTVGDVSLSINADILEADYVVNMPVLKTHGLTMVSLGIKNLKGMLNVASRKKCHNADQGIDLDYHISKFPEIVKPSLTIIDGIYTLEKGPCYYGEAHRSNILIASKDLVSADKVGSTVLGIDPQTVIHLALAAKSKNRPADLSDINITGEVDVETATTPHMWAPASPEILFELMGIRGVTIPFQDGDKTACTYCGHLAPCIPMGIIQSKNTDKHFDDIEILLGKIVEPTPGHKHTLLFGQCQVKKNAKNPLINHGVAVKGCPPSKRGFIEAFDELGIELPDNPMEWIEKIPEFFMAQYMGKPEFEEAFYRIQ
jgi:uncharacterized protein (DUF362 family)